MMIRMLFLLPVVSVALARTVPAQAADAQITLVIRESKVLFTHRTDAFRFDLLNPAQSLPCRTRYMYISTPQPLWTGWNPKLSRQEAAAVSERGQEYHFSSCRTATLEAFAWFPGEPERYEGGNDYRLLRPEYDPRRRPLRVRLRDLQSGGVRDFVCDGDRTRVQTDETEKSIGYEITQGCRAGAAPDAAERGVPDFVSAPGPFAALISYRGGMLPSVASTPDSLKDAAAKLFARIPEGRYAGVMSTLSKTCAVAVRKDGDVLYVEHTITTGKPRTRRLELKAADLLGFVEGEVYADPIRVENEAAGDFAAAEFRTGKAESLILRFEKKLNKEGQILRINGPEAYCRRLTPAP